VLVPDVFIYTLLNGKGKATSHALDNLDNFGSIRYTSLPVTNIVGVEVRPELSQAISAVVGNEMHTVQGVQSLLDFPVGPNLGQEDKISAHFIDHLENLGPQISVNGPSVGVGSSPPGKLINNVGAITEELVLPFMRYRMLQVEQKGKKFSSVHMLVAERQWAICLRMPSDKAVLT
jgi:hypothetical protein